MAFKEKVQSTFENRAIVGPRLPEKQPVTQRLSILSGTDSFTALGHNKRRLGYLNSNDVTRRKLLDGLRSF